MSQKPNLSPKPNAHHTQVKPKFVPSTYLFVWNSGSLVTYPDTLKEFKLAAQKIGIHPKAIGTHSARKSRITIGIKQGLPDTVLIQLGRWKSLDSIKPYINLEPMDLANVLADHMDF